MLMLEQRNKVVSLFCELNAFRMQSSCMGDVIWLKFFILNNQEETNFKLKNLYAASDRTQKQKFVAASLKLTRSAGFTWGHLPLPISAPSTIPLLDSQKSLCDLLSCLSFVCAYQQVCFSGFWVIWMGQVCFVYPAKVGSLNGEKRLQISPWTPD